tara:strand:+ start:2074 stop:3069 length:996 start_codon:yes stop_codon:yes gene_type:complete
MATDFKYASQSDLNRYVGEIVADSDSKRQVYNWETTGTTHFYKSYNTGFISVLFFDGIEGTPVSDDPDANYEFRYSEGNDSVEVFINTDNPNDIVVEAGFDNTTYYDQSLVDASMELNNLLDARFPMPLPKFDQFDANTSHSTASTEYDAIVIKMTCYIAASNVLRASGEIERADYYYDLVTNAEKTGMADRLNVGEFKLAFEVDSNDDKGKVRTISKTGSMDVVETAGEYVGEKYDVVRITCTTAGAYGTAIVKAETYGNDALFGTTTEDIKVTGGLQHIVNGLYIRFQGASMNLSGTADSWEVTVTSSERKLTNAQTGAIDLTRRGYSY